MMPFDLTRFKKINVKHKMTVFGYINAIQSLFPTDNSYYQIHDLIKQTCTIFYAPIHEWDTEFINAEVVKVIQETNSIIHTKRIDGMCSSSSFLKETFKSGIHHWRFRIDQCLDIGESWSSTIGIWKTKARITDNYPLRSIFTFFETSYELVRNTSANGYGFAYNIGLLTHEKYGSPCPY